MRGKNIRMRIGEDFHSNKQREREKDFSFKKEIKDELKEKGVDLVVDQALGIANITMPLDTLSILIKVFKTLEKQLENQLEQGMMR